MNGKCAIVVLSFDGYSDLWDTFFLTFNKYWKDNMYPIYLVTNNIIPDYKDVNIINVGAEISWSDRVRKALNIINEEYIILMLEDYFIGDKVNSNHIEELIKYCQEGSIDYLRIVPIPKTRYKDKKVNEIYQLRADRPYGVNLQAAIWKKEYFIKTLGSDDYSAWEFEKRQKNDSLNKVFGECKTVDYWAINILNGVIQGKWYNKTLKYFREQGIEINIGNRKVMSNKEVFIMEIRKYLLRVVPIKIQKKWKPFLKKIGFKFVT